MSAQIKAIIFDLGRVMLDFDHAIAAKRVSAYTSKTQSQIYEFFFDSPSTGEFEEGKIPPSEFFQQVKAGLGLDMDYRAFVPAWNEIFVLSEQNRQMHQLATCLKGEYPLLLLTNINVLHFDYIKSTFEVLEPFGHIVTSYEAGARKPDPRIYRQALGLLGEDARNVFYTDDRAELIEQARLLGLQSFTFTGLEQLKKDLISVGVDKCRG